MVWYYLKWATDPIFYHLDERGTPVAGSRSLGQYAGHNSHDEYGAPAAGNLGLFQYTGQKWISEIGLYDYKARAYDPKLGRFMQTDPIGYGDGMNMYGYVGGDPVNFTDPTGMCSLVDVGYSWYTPGGDYLGPAPGKYFVLRNCEAGAGGSAGANGGGVGDGSSDASGDIIVNGIRLDAVVHEDIVVTGVAPASAQIYLAATHKKGKRPSTKSKHQRGDARRGRDAGGEKADDGERRRPQRKRPKGHRGPWPLKGLLPLWFIPDFILDPCGPLRPPWETPDCPLVA